MPNRDRLARWRATMLRNTTFVYKLMAALALFSSILFVWEVVDNLLHPLEMGIYGNALQASPPMRLVYTVLLPPIFLFLGALIIRRARGNVIGLLILLIGLGSPSLAIRQ